VQQLMIRHNMEVAHRLIYPPGKCENIHGHSMWVTISVFGDVDGDGLMEGIDFGTFKKAMRDHIDSEYDHRLLLDAHDPWTARFGIVKMDDQLPGLRVCPGNPTTENIAGWIGEYTLELMDLPVMIKVMETAVNGFVWRSSDVPTVA
jgi:6-pyruvoyltetrahydropterin/6-carboxytetrahydropterin synthase